MSCVVPSDILTQYPKSVALVLYSTPEVGEISEGGIENVVNGYIDVLEKLSQSSESIPDTTRLENPFGAQLRLLSSLKGLDDRKDVYIENIQFTVYDHSLNGSTLAQTDTETFQDANTNTAVNNSQSTNDRFLTSPYRDAMVGNWQPNWFRPFVKINNTVIFDTVASYYKQGNHVGDKSIGFDFPFCIDVYRKFPGINKIEIFAFALMYIATATTDRKYKRFAVKAEIKLRTTE